MEWESKNNAHEYSPSSQDFIFGRERDIVIHMFLRKIKLIDGVVQPYIYLGRVVHVKHENERPVLFTFEFETPLGDDLYRDFTTFASLN